MAAYLRTYAIKVKITRVTNACSLSDWVFGFKKELKSISGGTRNSKMLQCISCTRPGEKYLMSGITTCCVAFRNTYWTSCKKSSYRRVIQHTSAPTHPVCRGGSWWWRRWPCRAAPEPIRRTNWLSPTGMTPRARKPPQGTPLRGLL